MDYEMNKPENWDNYSSSDFPLQYALIEEE